MRVAAVGATARVLHSDDLVEDEAVVAGEERSAVDHHVDLVGAVAHRVARIGELHGERGAAAGERCGDGGDADESGVRVAVGSAERGDRGGHHVAVDADRGDAWRRHIGGVGHEGLGDE